MMTYPLIGNYGINRDDYESIDPATFGLVVKDYCEQPSNWRSQESLGDFLKRENIPGIYGVDTRSITRKLRDKGTMKATLCDDVSGHDLQEAAGRYSAMLPENFDPHLQMRKDETLRIRHFFHQCGKLRQNPVP